MLHRKETWPVKEDLIRLERNDGDGYLEGYPTLGLRRGILQRNLGLD